MENRKPSSIDTAPPIQPKSLRFVSRFLGYVDLLGTTYQAPTLATGFASHFAQPLLREAYEARQAQGKSGEKQGELLSREEAEKVLDECMKVLFYRDARSVNKVCQTFKPAPYEIPCSRAFASSFRL
jgi:20S proteasome alpha/beta subunit